MRSVFGILAYARQYGWFDTKLETGFISLQFHCIYNDWFESDSRSTPLMHEDLVDPEKWKDLVIAQARGSVQVPTDEGEQHMELLDDWLHVPSPS